MKRYTRLWRNKLLPEAHCMDSLIVVLQDAQNRLQEMQLAGVRLQALSDDYYILHTHDPVIAERFDMDEDRDDYEHGGEGGEGS